jgi:hypothetical protein
MLLHAEQLGASQHVRITEQIRFEFLAFKLESSTENWHSWATMLISDKLMVAQPVRRFFAFHANRRKSMTMFTKAHLNWFMGQRAVSSANAECLSPLPIFLSVLKRNIIKKTPWSESSSEIYRPSDRRLSAKWLPTFANRGCHVVSVTDPYGRILGFLDRSRYFSIK